MNFTVKQFESSLRRVVRDEVAPLKANMATKKQVDDLTISVDGITKMFDSFLNTEWQTHLHDVHPRLEKRLTKIEKKLTA